MVHALSNNIGTLWVEANQKKVQAQLENKQAEIEDSDTAQRMKLESQQKTKSLLEAFHALPESEQAIIRLLYEAQMNQFLMGHWQKEKEIDPCPETHAKFLGSFGAFFEAHIEKTQLPF